MESYNQTQKRNKKRASEAQKNTIAYAKEVINIKEKKNYHPLIMRIKGVVLISFFFLNWLFFEQSRDFFQMIFGQSIGGLLLLFCMIPGVFVLFFVGVLLIAYAPQGRIHEMWTDYWFYSGPFVESGQSGQYNNINRVNDYVNCKASISDRDTASSMMSKMGAINSMSNTSEGRRSLEFMNAKMSLMTREDGFKYLSGKLKD